MKKHLILFTTILILTQGCAVGPQFHVNVDSISAPEAILKTKYILLPGVKDVDATDLQYREYSSYVERALVQRGYTKAENFAGANIAIFLGYGLGDPQTRQFTYSLPTYGQTGISSANTYGAVSTYGNTATYSSTTTYTPTYGITGTTTHIGTQTTYLRYMWLDAVDLDEYRKTEKEIQLWRTTVTSTGSSGDLRQVFPILVAASRGYICGNTGRQVKLILSESDRRVTDIKGLER